MTTDGDETREWRFGVDEVGEDAVNEPDGQPIEPESPRLEHVVFVLVGIAGTLLFLLGGV